MACCVTGTTTTTINNNNNATIANNAPIIAPLYFRKNSFKLFIYM